MLKINLLPIEQKKAIKMHFVFCNVIGSGLFLFLLSLILIIFLAGSLAFLNLKVYWVGKEIINEQNKVIKNETIRGIEKKIKNINAEIVNIDKIQENQSRYYQILLDISQNLLSQAKIESLEIEKGTERIIVSGYADTRESLLAIKNILENSSQYKNIDFPLSNLTNPRNINFNFSFTYEP